MIERLGIDGFLQRRLTGPAVLDVRTPAEFEGGHIPGARSLPLFSNEERARIGTMYKQEGRRPAVLEGLDLVGPRMRHLVEAAERLTGERGGTLVHCWRGGMRSGSVAWLLDFSGHRVATLEGGYKAFRRRVLEAFAMPREVIVLSGPTGAGKTDVLAALRARGEQVMDLEGLAQHKGSVFGGLGQGAQPTQEQFENDLAMAWLSLDPDRRVWVEDESSRIGRLLVPREILDQVASAPAVRLDVPAGVRTRRLVEDYGRFPAGQLVAATEVIRKRLGGLRTQQITAAIQRGDLPAACLALLDYYDRCYAHAAARRTPRATFTIPAHHGGAEVVAEEAVRAVRGVPTGAEAA